MEVNRVPSGVFSSIIAGATATQGKNHSDLSQTCIAFLDTFKFPAFEILVVLQVLSFYFDFCFKLTGHQLL